MSLSSATTQTVTNASGTVAIATTSTSLGVTQVIKDAPVDAIQLIDAANYVITTADKIGMFSAIIMFLSFAYNIYSSRKKQRIELAKVDLDEQYYFLRMKEYELDKIKYNIKEEE